MIDCSIRVVTVLLGYLDLLIATSWGPRRLPTLPTPKAGPVRAAIKTDYLSGFLGMELLKDESKSLFSTNC